MANQRRKAAPQQKNQSDSQSDYIRGGKGRKDEVGRSGIYPASSPDAPADAEFRRPDELVPHRGPQPTPRTPKEDEGG